MTLVVSWVRVTPSGEELVVASDSRLTGGLQLDHAPKIFRLERQDAVLAYCGPTILAYPIMLQIKASLDGYEETRSRIIDIVHLKAHIEKVIESLRSKIADLPCQDETNRAFKFLLAGYSWKMNSFRMWTFRYDVITGDFNAHSASGSGKFVFMSDMHQNEKNAKDSLVQRMGKNPKFSLGRLDWQPLEILLDFIRNPDIPDVGGPPQLVKIYKHANIMPVNFIWPKEGDKSKWTEWEYEITHLGRPLLGYERSRYLVMDPDTFELIEPWNAAKRLELLHTRETARVKKNHLAAVCGVIASLRDKRNCAELLNRLIKEKAPFERIKAFL